MYTYMHAHVCMHMCKGTGERPLCLVLHAAVQARGAPPPPPPNPLPLCLVVGGSAGKGIYTRSRRCRSRRRHRRGQHRRRPSGPTRAEPGGTRSDRRHRCRHRPTEQTSRRSELHGARPSPGAEIGAPPRHHPHSRHPWLPYAVQPRGPIRSPAEAAAGTPRPSAHPPRRSRRSRHPPSC